MLSVVTTMGRVTRDLEVKTSSKGDYIKIDLAVNKGFGDKQHANYYQCFVNGDECDRVIKAKVKKGSLITVTGDLELKSYEKKDGSGNPTGEKVSYLSVNVYSWDYVPLGKKHDDAQSANGLQPVSAPAAPASSIPMPYEAGDIPEGVDIIVADDDLPF